MGTLMMHVIAEAQPSSSQASMTKHPAMVIILSDAQHGRAVLLRIDRRYQRILCSSAPALFGVSVHCPGEDPRRDATAPRPGADRHRTVTRLGILTGQAGAVAGQGLRTCQPVALPANQAVVTVRCRGG